MQPWSVLACSAVVASFPQLPAVQLHCIALPAVVVWRCLSGYGCLLRAIVWALVCVSQVGWLSPH